MNSDSSLFLLSQAYFESILTELTNAGLSLSPKLELRESDGLLCYYDLNQQVIYLSMPDRNTAQAKLQLLLLRSLFACESDHEVLEFLKLALYWLLSHEVAHHLRHYHGLLSANVWHEEQIANQLALAISKPRFTTEEGFQTHSFLQKATQNLALKLDTKCNAVNSYHSLAHALKIAGLIDEATQTKIVLLKKETGLLCESILKKRLVNSPSDIKERISNRYQIIRQSEGTPQQNIFSHLYYYFAWMDIALMSSESFTIHEFASQYLSIQI